MSDAEEDYGWGELDEGPLHPDSIDPTDPVWITKEGEEVPVSKMGDRHLLNAERMMRGRLVEVDEMLRFGNSPMAPTGEIASDHFEEALDQALEDSSTIFAWVGIFQAEILKRGLTPKEVKKAYPWNEVEVLSAEPGPDGIGTIMELRWPEDPNKERTNDDD